MNVSENLQQSPEILDALFYPSKGGSSAPQAKRRSEPTPVNDSLTHQVLQMLQREIHIIQGCSELALAASASEQENIQQTLQAGQRANALLEQVRQWLQIHHSEKSFSRRPCPLDTFLNLLDSLCRQQARQKGLNWFIERKDPLPVTFSVYDRGLRNCLLRIVDNAIRFTSEGSITVTVQVDNYPEKPAIQFIVGDTGEGIEPDCLPNVFEPFYVGTPASDGFGLGLTLARAWADAIGGRLDIQSAPGEGTQVQLTIPL